jgi:hypothetical protein
LGVPSGELARFDFDVDLAGAAVLCVEPHVVGCRRFAVVTAPGDE